MGPGLDLPPQGFPLMPFQGFTGLLPPANPLCSVGQRFSVRPTTEEDSKMVNPFNPEGLKEEVGDGSRN